MRVGPPYVIAGQSVLQPDCLWHAAGCLMTSEAATHLHRLRDRLAKAVRLKEIIRNAPDRLRRDAAIIAYTRTLDLLVEDLITLEEIGLMAACAARLGAVPVDNENPLP